MYTQEITVNNEVGLHARPATFLHGDGSLLSEVVFHQLHQRGDRLFLIAAVGDQVLRNLGNLRHGAPSKYIR